MMRWCPLAGLGGSRPKDNDENLSCRKTVEVSRHASYSFCHVKHFADKSGFHRILSAAPTVKLEHEETKLIHTRSVHSFAKRSAFSSMTPVKVPSSRVDELRELGGDVWLASALVSLPRSKVRTFLVFSSVVVARSNR
ncbi:unnamed protein product [Hapterophycus canaliculatus]